MIKKISDSSASLTLARKAFLAANFLVTAVRDRALLSTLLARCWQLYLVELLSSCIEAR